MSCLLLNKSLVFGFILILHVNVFAQVQDHRFIALKYEPVFTITPGEEHQLLLSFLIKEGYHIQANQVKDENLIPSVLSIQSTEGLIIGDPVYPQADELKMEGVKDPLAVFGDALVIQVPVRTTNPMNKENFLIIGQLYYQPCDASKCYYPREFDFSMRIMVQ